MDNIFTIKNEDLERLSNVKGVEFFRDLLHAKARMLRISSSGINVSSDIYVRDGGIDASVNNCPVESDLIKFLFDFIYIYRVMIFNLKMLWNPLK